ncbi:MAG: (2Fe-2S) ferredoxin domain-containing protein [Clostridiales bacterium]|nr:(2Fe-2S) ferredoxin domain-containing protein [Clostridiales bacterium]
MPIKSLDDLKKIREKNSRIVALRERGESSDERIEILVGMATCGIAAGARDTMISLKKAVDDMKLENISVIPVGCIGYCHSEPTVQVNIPGDAPIIYGNVDEIIAEKIIYMHILNKELIDDHLLNKIFTKA